MALFQKDEYLERLRNTKTRMDASGMDVLVVADPANMNYLTGYDGWSFYVPQVVVVALDAEEPIWIGRGMDAHGAKHTTFLSEDGIIGFPGLLCPVPGAASHELRRRCHTEPRMGRAADRP